MWQRAHVKSQVLSQRPGLRDGQAGPGAGAAGAGSFFSPDCREPALLYGQATGGGSVGVGPGRGRGGAGPLCPGAAEAVLRCGGCFPASLSSCVVRSLISFREHPLHTGGQGWEWGQWDKLRTPWTPKKTRHLFLREKAGNREGRATSGSCTACVLSKILKHPRYENIRKGISDAISLGKTMTYPQGTVRWR